MMQSCLVHSDWNCFIDNEMIMQNLKSIFLDKCDKGTISLKELKKFIVEHYFYSKNFIRFLCALMSNLPNRNDIVSLLNNLNEELGLVGVNSIPHSVIYKDMAKNIGVELTGEAQAQTQILIKQMYEYCYNPDPIYGLSALCLGAEAIVPSLYSSIMNGFIVNGFTKEELLFFTIHIECDNDHAKTMQSIIQNILNVQPEKIETVRSVASKMLQLRSQFLDSLIII